MSETLSLVLAPFEGTITLTANEDTPLVLTWPTDAPTAIDAFAAISDYTEIDLVAETIVAAQLQTASHMAGYQNGENIDFSDLVWERLHAEPNDIGFAMLTFDSDRPWLRALTYSRNGADTVGFSHVGHMELAMSGFDRPAILKAIMATGTPAAIARAEDAFEVLGLDT